MRVFARTPINLDAITRPLGQIYLIPERCKDCGLCIHFCPKHVLQESTQINTKGYHYPEIVSGMEKECVNCEFCSMVCPEFAIFTLEVES